MDKSPFKKLSAELRNNIYELVLSSPDPICISVDTDEYASMSAITRVCRQIRNESVLLYHSVNSFVYNFGHNPLRESLRGPYPALEQYTAHIGNWLTVKPREHLQAMKSLTLKVDCQPNHWPSWYEYHMYDFANIVERIKQCGCEDHQISIEFWLYGASKDLLSFFPNAIRELLHVPVLVVAAPWIDGAPWHAVLPDGSLVQVDSAPFVLLSKKLNSSMSQRGRERAQFYAQLRERIAKKT